MVTGSKKLVKGIGSFLGDASGHHALHIATGAFVEGFFWRILTSQFCIHFCTFANRHTGRLVENASDLAACLGELGFFPVYRFCIGIIQKHLNFFS
ncbi:hypothetical protein ARMGADRAFT_759663 [Armillaria gallica]|uniref:Uncharacterized protein n=1 Tax=Armillaria gallica TaxID=47427 RepID=A0A2H3DXJ4_ARMGA|nr:hypothetical protein ARMGADRAFT_759663 [Armillaria gallica]